MSLRFLAPPLALRKPRTCFPGWTPAERRRVARLHFRWLGRSILERSLLWYAPAERLQRLIHVEGDVALAEKKRARGMWLVPHFMGLVLPA